MEDTEPFCCVGDEKVDPVITAIEKVRVVDKAFVCKHEAGVGVRSDQPFFCSVSFCLFVPVFHVIEYCLRPPKQIFIVWIDDVGSLEIFKDDPAVEPSSLEDKLTSEKSIFFVDFNDVLDVKSVADFDFFFIFCRWWDKEFIVTNRGGNRLHSQLPGECNYLQSTRVYGDH